MRYLFSSTVVGVAAFSTWAVLLYPIGQIGGVPTMVAEEWPDLLARVQDVSLVFWLGLWCAVQPPAPRGLAVPWILAYYAYSVRLALWLVAALAAVTMLLKLITVGASADSGLVVLSWMVFASNAVFVWFLAIVAAGLVAIAGA